jgi:hypothetical protein
VYRLAFNGVPLSPQPTSDNYSRELIEIGNTRRSLSGRLVQQITARKWRWTLKLYIREQWDVWIDLLDTTFTFRDHDGREYQVRMTQAPGADAYPKEILGMTTLVIEEV